MQRQFRRSGVLFLCLFALLFSAGPLCSEEIKEKGRATDIETITVTANKIEENIQDVPRPRLKPS